MWIVWTVSWPDTSKVEVAVHHMQGAIPKEPKLVACFEIKEEHRHYSLAHLQNFECYALPANYRSTLQGDTVKSLDATKKLPSGS